MYSYKKENLLAPIIDENPVNTNILIDTYQKNEKPYKILKDSIAQYKRMSKEGNSNIFERGFASYFLPDPESINRFFRAYECCSVNGFSLKFCEKQIEANSGIFLDIDIYQETDEISISKSDYAGICEFIIEVLQNVIIIEDADPIHIVILQKASIKKDKEKNMFKNGLHILLPGVKISRGAKKIFIARLAKHNDLAEIFPFVPESYRELIFDRNSAHVPVFLFGSISKDGGSMYEMRYAAVSTFKRNKRIISEVTEELMEKSIVSWELSVNWEVQDRDYPTFIQKKEYKVAEKWAQREAQNMEKYQKETELEEVLMSNTENPEFEYIKDLLDIMAPSRSEFYIHWFRILTILAKRNSEYKSLAKYFSAKCPTKYDPIDFEKHWTNAFAQSRSSDMDFGLLEAMARKDSPEKFVEVKKNTIFGYIDKIVYDHIFRGAFQHYHVANILYSIFQNKFVHDGESNTWYEYITETDSGIEKGEIYKWRRWTFTCPSLSNYISEDLLRVLSEHYNRIQSKLGSIETEQDPKIKKIEFYRIISKNLVGSIKSLMDDNYKRGVLSQARNRFNKRNFARRLDVCEDAWNVIGVGNGVLLLGGESKLIQEAHTYPISQFTPIDYGHYDPTDPDVREVYLTLRNMFTDKESDSFEFLLFFMASALDFGIKENLILMVQGEGSNGKSMLLELMINTLGLVDNNGYSAKVASNFWTDNRRSADSATPALVALAKARFAYSSEFKAGAKILIEKAKEVTSGENMTGRALFKDNINFTVKSMFILLSNYEFEIDGNDEGTWRRFLMLKIRITFAIGDSFDETNPYHRRGNPNMQKKWNRDPRILRAFLSILVHHYEILQKKYDGCLRLVPKPTIDRDSAEFRNKQDRFNNFICSRIVRTSDKEEIFLDELVNRYMVWHQAIYTRQCDRNHAVNSFRTSKLGRYISNTINGVLVITSHKFVDIGYTLGEGESFYSSDISSKKNNSMMSETPLEFYERKCREFQDRGE